MYIYTANAFVYGHFKGAAVKEQVYEPDWRSEERTQYTINVADILADVCPAGIAPSIQSAPLGFKPRVTGHDVVASYTDNVLRVVAHLIALEAKTGRTVQLALEPEPFCFLETTDETIAYFRDHLYSGAVGREARQARARADRRSQRSAAPASRHRLRHLPSGGRIRGHHRVAAEAGRCRRSDLQAAGSRRAAHAGSHAAASSIRSSATPRPSISPRRWKSRTARSTATSMSTTPSPRSRRIRAPREWRTHIHVPVFLDDLGQFRTTRFAIEDALRFHKQKPLSRHLEVETYTWDMLPDSLKTGDIVDYVCRELDWVRGQLV